MTLVVSGFVAPNTGIGVIQRNVYPRFQERFDQVRLAPSREPVGGPVGRLAGLYRGLRPIKRSPDSVLFAVVPPLPLGGLPPTVAVVHDLRWQRTRSGIGRVYRQWDFMRTLRKSNVVICVSSRTWLDIRRVVADESIRAKLRVAHLGPGICTGQRESVASRGSILVVGSASHKKNEYALKLLEQAKPEWLSSITGVGVSEEAKGTAERLVGKENCSWFEGISDAEMADTYRRNQFFLCLSTDEGFGMPFIEAASQGCTPIVFDQPLIAELLGDSCATIQAGPTAQIIVQLRDVQPSSSSDLYRAASRYSWEQFADVCADAIAEVKSLQASGREGFRNGR